MKIAIVTINLLRNLLCSTHDLSWPSALQMPFSALPLFGQEITQTALKQPLAGWWTDSRCWNSPYSDSLLTVDSQETQSDWCQCDGELKFGRC